MKSKLQEIVLAAVEEINETLDSKLAINDKESCQLYGNGSGLDSISLVALIVTVEQKIEDELGASIILANEKAMSRRNSPFITVGTLVDYASELVEESSHV
jgi:acyl carrier protein